ncbi:Asp-tRNAAsn/Glu-tRNAGln amidotransferase A subunit [Granulicatella balaenopterae]|uniref:Asp-tRNAAsn/Glu-tRNAGln amidotransferase A subunit n=1 Tax=Granulicatella balaenopterae TaxID=137733 RepID=A0A1H9IR24_9LACT|nr:amidase family protein [Granulicatella balaenopterae]SEQ77034.1 Asp-tRNAAsn/Glu-tRNAGln amidotransferase A subunit [Granulicatella balaenopterae]
MGKVVKQFWAVVCSVLFVLVSVPYEQQVFAEDHTSQSQVVENKEHLDLSVEEYKRMTALELAELVRSHKVTAEQLVTLAYQVIDSENPSLNAVITTRKEAALEEARNLEDTGQPFLGVPLLIKGIGHNIAGGENTLALKTNENNPLTKRDSSYVRDFKKLGFIILGQTNYPELALRNITTGHLYGLTHNAWNPAYNSGGSSGGSAAALASGMTPIATGSDMGGSIRIPASWNGLIGFKTSGGVTHHSGMRSMVVHFPLTKSVDDTVAFFDGVENPKFHDDVQKITDEVSDVKDLKIGYSLESPMGTKVSEDAKKAVLEAVDFLREQGFTVEEASWPIDGRAIMEDYTLMSIGSGGLPGNLPQKFEELGLTKHDLDPLVWALYNANKQYGRDAMKKDYAETKKHIEKYIEQMETFHQTYPLFLTPTTATTAPLNSNDLIDDEDEIAMYNSENLTKEEQWNLLVRQWEPMLERTPFTAVINIVGEPAISLPTYLSKENLPLGIMLNAKWGMDKVLLKVAKIFEDQHKFTLKEDIAKADNTDNDSSDATTGEPTTSTEQPSTGTQTPTTGVETPSTGNQTPNSGTEQPSTSTEQPSTGTQTSSTGTQTPTIDAETPTIDAETPTIDAETPTTGTETPSTGTETPTTGTETPNSGTEQPSTGTEQPTTNKQKPAKPAKPATPEQPVKPTLPTTGTKSYAVQITSAVAFILLGIGVIYHKKNNK